MLGRQSRKSMSITVSLPAILVKALDDLATEAETTRTDIIESFLKFGLDNVDDVFPLDEEEEEEKEGEEEETADPGLAPRPKKGPGGGWY